MDDFRTINIGLLESEDRLVVEFVGPENRVKLLLTRRITRNLIGGVANLLASSSVVMARAPFDMKRDVLIFEHLSATQSPESSDSAGATAAGEGTVQETRTALLAKVDIQTHPDNFRVNFLGVGDLSLSVNLGRAELHRFLATLHRISRAAEWDLDREAGWLLDAEAPQAAPLASLS